MERPISPHLQIYRLPLTAVMSIVHRLTGVASIVGLLLISSLFIGAAYGPSSYDGVASIVLSWFGVLLLALFTLSVCYHLCNGIRHLVWDTGRALDLVSVHRGAIAVLVATAVLVVAVLI